MALKFWPDRDGTGTRRRRYQNLTRPNDKPCRTVQLPLRGRV